MLHPDGDAQLATAPDVLSDDVRVRNLSEGAGIRGDTGLPLTAVELDGCLTRGRGLVAAAIEPSTGACEAAFRLVGTAGARRLRDPGAGWSAVIDPTCYG
jgi:hypothetical protein